MLMSHSAFALPGRPDRSEVACRLDPDTGVVTIETSVAEAGQGTYPLLARLVSKELSVDQSRVVIEYNASEEGAHDPGMFASLRRHATGSAAMQAGMLLRANMIEEGSRLLGVESERVEITPDWTSLRVRDSEDIIKISELPPLRVIGAYETSDPGPGFGVQYAEVSGIPSPAQSR